MPLPELAPNNACIPLRCYTSPNVASAHQAHTPTGCQVQSYAPVMTGPGCAEPVPPFTARA